MDQATKTNAFQIGQDQIRQSRAAVGDQNGVQIRMRDLRRDERFAPQERGSNLVSPIIPPRCLQHIAAGAQLAGGGRTKQSEPAAAGEPPREPPGKWLWFSGSGKRGRPPAVLRVRRTKCGQLVHSSSCQRRARSNRDKL